MHRCRRFIPLAVVLLGLLTSPAVGATKTKTIKSKATLSTTKKATATTRIAATTRVTATVASTTIAAPATTAVSTNAAPTTLPPATGSINVFAAASLTASFTEIAAAFERANPGAKVTLNFAGSSTLVTQINNGAPADVFASADTANMERLVTSKLIRTTPVIFTKNKPMIVVPKGNPLRVKGLADLGRPEVFVALGAVGVPVGDYSRQILAKAGITVTPKSLESSVTAIVSKAALKEIDAGIVYVTDVAIDEYRVDGIAIPDELNVTATYPIATLAASRNPTTAAAFVAYTQSSATQSILAKYKFLTLK